MIYYEKDGCGQCGLMCIYETKRFPGRNIYVSFKLGANQKINLVKSLHANMMYWTRKGKIDRPQEVYHHYKVFGFMCIINFRR